MTPPRFRRGRLLFERRRANTRFGFRPYLGARGPALGDWKTIAINPRLGLPVTGMLGHFRMRQPLTVKRWISVPGTFDRDPSPLSEDQVSALLMFPGA